VTVLVTTTVAGFRVSSSGSEKNGLVLPDSLPDPDFVAALTARHGLTEVRPLGTGLEFTVYQAVDRSGNTVVLRVSRGGRFQSNANDPRVDTRMLLEWEYRVTGHLGAYGFPVAAPVEFVVGAPDVLVSRYVPDDGAGVDPVRLGALLSRLHRLPAPPLSPPASEGQPAWRLLPHRIARRWQEVAALVPELPPCPPEERLAALLVDRPAGSLLHLDVRAANLRCEEGSVRAFLDWSNAMVGDPALELGRLVEFARFPENGLDVAGVFRGYGVLPDLEHPSFLVYRLDAAVMLAVVFLSETPDPVRGPAAVEQLFRVWHRLAPRLA